MPRGDGIYDEEHADEGKPGTPGSSSRGRHAAKEVPEDTPDVDRAEDTAQEPPD